MTRHARLIDDPSDMDVEWEHEEPPVQRRQHPAHARVALPLAALLVVGIAAKIFALKPSSRAGLEGIVLAASKDVEETATPSQIPSKDALDDEGMAKPSKKAEPTCKMAEKGDDCYKSAVWAMTEGVAQHPEWYPNLTKRSLFEDFQSVLALDPNETKCHRAPCKAPENCETADATSDCYSGVQWDMTEGISSHPDWYEGLTKDSTFEEFQLHLHENNKTLCPTAPCNAQPFQMQTLFCWMVVMPEGYEQGLVSAQFEQKAGVFACDDYALVSSTDVAIGDVPTLIISSTDVGGYTGDGTSPNAPIFVEAWQKINGDGRWRNHDWVVKSDPDAVLVPDRLVMTLLPGQQPEDPYPPPYEAEPGAGQFVTNCDKMANWGKGWGDGWPMMYGSLEVISREALEQYFARKDECQGPDGMGEDAYMGLCLRQLKVGELFMKQADGTCAGGDCSDQSFSSYHPYKDAGSWFECWGQATR